MSDKVQGYVRKQFNVQAAQVTPQNIEELASWCGGKIMHDGEKEGHFSREYIKVRVQFPQNEEQTKAYVGFWIVKQGRNFKVYKDKSFRNTFELGSVGQPRRERSQDRPRINVPSPANMPKKRTPEADVSNLEGAKILSPQESVPGVLEEIPESAIESRDLGNSEIQEVVEHPLVEEVERSAAEAMGAAEFPEAESAIVPQPITLDQLNDQVGDPRSAQEIRAEGH